MVDQHYYVHRTHGGCHFVEYFILFLLRLVVAEFFVHIYFFDFTFSINRSSLQSCRCTNRNRNRNFFYSHRTSYFEYTLQFCSILKSLLNVYFLCRKLIIYCDIQRLYVTRKKCPLRTSQILLQW